MPAKMKFGARRAIQIALAAGFVCVAWTPAAFSAPTGDETISQSESQARADWRENIAHVATPAEGCFHATYPSILWQKVDCKTAPVRYQPPPRRIGKNQLETTGNGNDYVIKSSSLISQTVGSFPTVTGVKSEKGVGVAAFGGGGILGPNEYTLQINSSFDQTTAACKSHSGCTIWQQYVYSPDYSVQGEAAVFIEYWLIGYGSSCPSGWESDGEGDCVKNSAYTSAPDVAITQLGSLKLTGTAKSGGNDTAVFTDGTEAYTLTAKDSVLDLATAWYESEFNVVGNAGGSEAQFNSGSSVQVKVAVTNGSTATPSCVADAGTTGETNNLNLGSCSAAGGSTPYIQFTESN